MMNADDQRQHQNRRPAEPGNLNEKASQIMKITTFRSLADGSLAPAKTLGASSMSAESRMTRAMFEQIHGGEQVNDLAAARVNNIPPGTVLWRTKSGNLMAIAD